MTDRLRNANLFVILGTVAATVVLALALSQPVAATTCYEDQPCWNGQTMGNRITGEWHEPTGTYQLVKWADNGRIRST